MVTKGSTANIKAVLFDMDGLLLDSERIYTEVTNDILRPYGKIETSEIKANIMGKPDPIAAHTLLSMVWPPTREGELYGPDCPFDVDGWLKVEGEKLQTAFDSISQMPGAQRLVQHLHKHKVPICIATTSSRKAFEKKSAQYPELFGPFADRVICGDDPRLSRGKPNPDIFVLAAREGLFSKHDNEEATHERLGEHWVQGLRELGPDFDGTQHLKGGESTVLVFEDGKPGVQGAKAAGMHVVWVPDPKIRALYPNEELGASRTIPSLLDFDPTEWGLPPFDDVQ